MALEAELEILERARRLFAISREHVEAQLRVVDFFRLALEREQTDGLLLQFVDAGLAALAGGLEHVRDDAADGESAVQRIQDQRQSDRRRMSDHMYRTGGRAVARWLDLRSPNPRARMVFGRVRQVDQRREDSQLERGAG